MHSAAGGTIQRLNPGPAMVRLRLKNPADWRAPTPPRSIELIGVLPQVSPLADALGLVSRVLPIFKVLRGSSR